VHLPVASVHLNKREAVGTVAAMLIGFAGLLGVLAVT
jgi:hypothetical protein